jgi:translation initiation factor IF-2
MDGLLDPTYREIVMGRVEVREIYKIPKIGVIAGCFVTEGKVVRNKPVRLIRDGVELYEGKISSLKRFKDDASEVKAGYECGLGIENYNDLKSGDLIEVVDMELIKPGDVGATA